MKVKVLSSVEMIFLKFILISNNCHLLPVDIHERFTRLPSHPIAIALLWTSHRIHTAPENKIVNCDQLCDVTKSSPSAERGTGARGGDAGGILASPGEPRKQFTQFLHHEVAV